MNTSSKASKESSPRILSVSLYPTWLSLATKMRNVEAEEEEDRMPRGEGEEEEEVEYILVCYCWCLIY